MYEIIAQVETIEETDVQDSPVDETVVESPVPETSILDIPEDEFEFLTSEEFAKFFEYFKDFRSGLEDGLQDNLDKQTAFFDYVKERDEKLDAEMAERSEESETETIETYIEETAETLETELTAEVESVTLQDVNIHVTSIENILVVSIVLQALIFGALLAMAVSYFLKTR